jgi:hypothetical protein
MVAFGGRIKRLRRLSLVCETEAEAGNSKPVGQREIFDAQDEAFLVVDVFDLSDWVNLRDLDPILRKTSMTIRGYPKYGRS